MLRSGLGGRIANFLAQIRIVREAREQLGQSVRVRGVLENETIRTMMDELADSGVS